MSGTLSRRGWLATALGAALVAAGLGARGCQSMGKRTASPQRPAGAAKPMLDEDIAPVLARLDAWYAAHLAADAANFNPPASEAQLDAFERLVRVRLPRAYRQLYGWHDGENDDRRGHIYGLPILSLDAAGREWLSWQKVAAGFGGNRYAIPGGGWPVGAVDPAYTNPGWIPLTADGSGNHLGLDFAPWPGGRVGQIILYGRDEDVKAVLAPSLGRFLAWLATLLESGNFRLDVAPGEQVLRHFRLKTPAVDDFQDGARTLLGAPGPYL
ncbi:MULTISPECIES: SMI1/KNR4 family protein [Sphingomonas]|uniref:SMI1/KNR4 family protein n=1 Tax=Sphingomonas TaxID=13687 RepID=UPI000DEFFB18|nr:MULTISPECIES: SMI1/KNR4 family protein [Sphingomonas]